MEQYLEYRNTEIEWLPKIPTNWEQLPLFTLVTENKVKNTDNACENVLSLSYGKIKRKDIESNFGLLPAEYSAYQIVHPGYILLRLTDLQNDKKSLRTGYVKEYGIITSAYVALIPNDKINSRFLSYLLHAYDVMKVYYALGNGVRQSMNFKDLKRLPIFLPSDSEQEKILMYLHTKTAQIDSLIADKEKLITLLKEKRQAIISEAVTRGLDSTAPMKDSGVEWSGQIPAHWDKKRIKFVFEIVKRIYGKEDRDVLSITQHGIKVRDIESNDGQLAQDYSKYQVVNIHDFAMNSMDLLTGYVDCSAYEGVTSPDYRVFRFMPEKVMCHAYYTYLFQMCYSNKIFYGFGQGVSNLGRWRLQTDTFLNFWIPIPPLNEQEEIARYIAVQAKRIDELIALAERQIVLLKEYRQSIISEAVTGKIMVTAPQSVEQTEQPAAKSGGANVHFKRRVLAAKILDKLCGEPTLGHVKLEKLLFLSEYCAELDMHTEYVRHAAGPYSPKTLRSIDTQLQKAKWFLYDKNNRGSKYSRLDKSAEYLPYFDANFSAAQNATVERLVELFRPLDTERCEIVATLYGAWNDFLIDGCSPTDEQIADEVLTHWSEEKKRIDKDRWLKAIGWMRKHQIVPCGYGEKTKRRDS